MDNCVRKHRKPASAGLAKNSRHLKTVDVKYPLDLKELKIT